MHVVSNHFGSVKKAELVSRNGVKFFGDSDYVVMGYVISFCCKTNSS